MMLNFSNSLSINEYSSSDVKLSHNTFEI